MAIKVTNLTIKAQTGSGGTHYASWDFKSTSTTTSSGAIQKGSLVSISSNATYYNGVTIPQWVKNDKWYIDQVKGDRAVLGKNASGKNNIQSAINIKYLSTSGGSSSTVSTNTLDHYEVSWYYDSGDGIWFSGGSSTNTTSKYSTYSAPQYALRIKVSVKPVAKTYKVNQKDVSYWTGTTEAAYYSISADPPEIPSAPTVKVEKYKLTASLENISDSRADQIAFEVFSGTKSINYGIINVVTRRASFSCGVAAGGDYRVRCLAININGKTKIWGNWSEFSSSVSAIPNTPSEITVCKANSENSVYLEWKAAKGAKKYDIEYTTEKRYFDGSDQTTVISGIEYTHYEKTGLESGDEYFFRVRAVNDVGESSWSGIKSVIIGKKPAAPTTWSSSTTVITGEPLNLYWVHNSEDNSSQTYAELELYINDVKTTKTIKNSTKEDEKDKTSVYAVDTSTYLEGTKIKWRVRTSGITNQFGDWSIQRTVDIYAPPTLELSMTNVNDNVISTLTSFPFYIGGIAGPTTQTPIGYHLTVVSNDVYTSVDEVGNKKIVNQGDVLYSKYFDTNEALLVEFSANNIDLENGVNYTVSCVVSMNSGLTGSASLDFDVSWTDVAYEPNAEIAIDEESLVAYIRPYCMDSDGNIVEKDFILVTDQPDDWSTTYEEYYTKSGSTYTKITSETAPTWAANTYYSANDITLSVYRREFDGEFTELATGIDSISNTMITDPHPALDYARYRIVAITKTTGAVSFYDPPGYPIGGNSVIIQWDEDWSNFDNDNEDAMEQPPWSGSLLKLPYNVDVSNSNSRDVDFVEYIGRSHPVSYYGTQVGETATWNVEIEKDDEETLYALRRLAKWMGNAYVREPSGSGYWASVSVSFSQKHLDLTIPVTFSITRVEGGV